MLLFAYQPCLMSTEGVAFCRGRGLCACVCLVLCVLARRPLREEGDAVGASRQRAVVGPVAVGRGVGARRVGEDATRRDDDGPPLLLLAALPLGALNVLDRLQGVTGRAERNQRPTAPSSVQCQSSRKVPGLFSFSVPCFKDKIKWNIMMLKYDQNNEHDKIML